MTSMCIAPPPPPPEGIIPLTSQQEYEQMYKVVSGWPLQRLLPWER